MNIGLINPEACSALVRLWHLWLAPRPQCSLTAAKKGKQQPAAAAAAAGAEEGAKMERSFPAGCCGLPADYGQAHNCTLGFLVISDVCEALIQVGTLGCRGYSRTGGKT